MLHTTFSRSESQAKYPAGLSALAQNQDDRDKDHMRTLLAKLDGIIDEHDPTRFKHLRPAATPQALRELEHSIGRTLPAEFRELYLWRDGQDYELADHPGYHFYLDFFLMPLARVEEIFHKLDRQLKLQVEYMEDAFWVPFLEQADSSFFCLVVPADKRDRHILFPWHVVQVGFELGNDPAGDLSFFVREEAPDFKTWFSAYVKCWESVPDQEWAQFAATGDEVFLGATSIIYYPKITLLGRRS